MEAESSCSLPLETMLRIPAIMPNHQNLDTPELLLVEDVIREVLDVGTTMPFTKGREVPWICKGLVECGKQGFKEAIRKFCSGLFLVVVKNLPRIPDGKSTSRW
jgi:hypothetical protein